MPYRRFVRACLVLACLALAACSGLGQSARLKRQADDFLADGRLPEAILTYRQALVSSPDDPGLLTSLGLALSAQGRNRSAAHLLEQAASLEPDDASIREALAGLVTRPEDGLSLGLAWQANVMDAEPVGLSAAAGRVFVVHAGGHLAALEQSSGQALWEVESPVPFTSPPSADADQVWVGAEDGRIFVYDAGSGRTLGSYPTHGAVYAAPALTPEFAYCPSNDGVLYVLRRKSLELAWKAETSAALHVSPLVSEQAVYVGSSDGRVYGFDALSGERIWAYGIMTQGAVESIPALADGRVLVGSGDSRLYALDAETGGEYWRFSTPDAVFARPLVLGEQVILASSGHVLACLQVSDGAPQWSLTFDGPITEPPAFFKERLFLATRSDPRLFAVHPEDGRLLGELNTGDWIAHGPLVSGADLILVGKDGAVFLYR